MENTLLIGLSRQIALQRQMDVVANNVANINTTGFKAETSSLFEEYLMPARTRTTSPPRPPLSFVQDRGTFHDFGGAASSRPATRSTSRSTAKASSRCRPRSRRALHPQRLAADQRTGQLVTTAATRSSATGARSSSSRPTRHHHRRRRHDHHLERRQGPTLADRRVRFVRPQALTRKAATTCFRRPARRRRPTQTRVMQGFIEKSNVSGVAEMSRMIEVTRAYTQPRLDDAAAGRHAPLRHREASRQPAGPEGEPDARTLPQRPAWRPRNSTFRSSPTTSPTCAPPATSASAPSSRICSTSRCAAPARRPRPGHHPAGRHRDRLGRQDGRHAARDEPGHVSPRPEGTRRRHPRRRLLPIQLPDGRTAYTRDGSFERDAEGRSSPVDGYPDQPASRSRTTPPGLHQPAGQVSVEACPARRRRPAARPDPARALRQQGRPRIGSATTCSSRRKASGTPQDGNAECRRLRRPAAGLSRKANVNAVTEIADLIAAQRAYEMNAKVISAADQMLQSSRWRAAPGSSRTRSTATAR
jgi:flagellar basal-body rod protein FlgF